MIKQPLLRAFWGIQKGRLCWFSTRRHAIESFHRVSSCCIMLAKVLLQHPMRNRGRCTWLSAWISQHTFGTGAYGDPRGLYSINTVVKSGTRSARQCGNEHKQLQRRLDNDRDTDAAWPLALIKKHFVQERCFLSKGWDRHKVSQRALSDCPFGTWRAEHVKSPSFQSFQPTLSLRLASHSKTNATRMRSTQ